MKPTARRSGSRTPSPARIRHRYTNIGDNFNPEIGFVQRDNFRRSFGSLRFSPRPKASKVVRKYTWEGSFEYILNGAGALARFYRNAARAPPPLACLRHAHEASSEIKLCQLTKPVRALFELVRMHRVFEIFNTPDEAERSYSIS